MIERVCVVGAGVIGSLFAGHLARVADVSCLVRRDDHARELNEAGLRVSGRHEFVGRVAAATDPGELDEPDLVLVCTKATGLDGLLPRWPDAFRAQPS